MNPNWVRWIRASVNIYFNGIVSPNLPLFIEGTDRRIEGTKDSSELRLDGPHINELSKGYWQFDLVIDVLILSYLNDQNIYTLESNIGNVLAAFTTDIPVFMYGDGPGDNPSIQLGCLKLYPGTHEPVIVTNFGQVQNNVRLRQSSVEATYRMNLTL